MTDRCPDCGHHSVVHSTVGGCLAFLDEDGERLCPCTEPGDQLALLDSDHPLRTGEMP